MRAPVYPLRRHIAPVVSSEDKWTCLSCETKNEYEVLNCHECLGPRGVSIVNFAGEIMSITLGSAL